MRVGLFCFVTGKRNPLKPAETPKERFVLRLTEYSQNPMTGRAVCSRKGMKPDKEKTKTKTHTFTYSGRIFS